MDQTPRRNQRLPATSKTPKGSLWEKEDIRKRHLRFIEEEQADKIRRNKTQRNWGDSLDIGSFKTSNYSPQGVAKGFINQMDFGRQSMPSSRPQASRRESFKRYIPLGNTTQRQELQDFRKKKAQESSEVQELEDTLTHKDAQIRKLKKENVRLKTQLRTQFNQIEVDSTQQISQQQKTIEALRLQLRQIIQPQGVTVEGRTFYAQELERQVSTLQTRLMKAQENNQQLQRLISTMYVEGAGKVSRTHSGTSAVTKFKLLECMAILEAN